MIKLYKRIIVKFGLNNPEKAYKVNVSDIIISPNFARSHPRQEKMIRKRNYFYENNQFESKIKLNKDFLLLDGYTSYLIAKEVGKKYVDVYFVNRNYYLKNM